MSESDSFINEVSEEVRRDRLFNTFKKYAWVLVVGVVAIVGGTGYNEWDKSQRETEARQTGELMRAASNAGNTAALEALANAASPSALIARLQRANLLEAQGDVAGAVAAWREVANDPEAANIYTDLAWLKIVMVDGANMESGERNSAYDRLTAPGAPYRILAQEQRAMQYIRDGDIDAAKVELAAIVIDPGITPNLRARAQQLIVALGGENGSVPTEG